MREFINRYGAYVAAAAVVLTGLIIWYFGLFSSPSMHPATKAWYIDDETGEESVQPITSVPPLMNKNGKPTLVEVIKVSCQTNGRNPKVAYYRKYREDLQPKIAELQAQGPSPDPAKTTQLQNLKSEAEMIRLPATGSPWVRALSPEGEKIRDAVMCPGQTTIAVYPQ